MRRASALPPSSPPIAPKAHSASSMSCAPIESPRPKAPVVYSWASGHTSSPPPYEPYDAYVAASTTVNDARLDSKQRQPVSSYAEYMIGLGSSPRQCGNLSIPRLRDALSSLETKMANLMNEREMLESRLEQAVRLQSPIQRLPNELLASIFVVGVLDTDQEESLMLSTLMLVCHYWKEVALTTPLLWSRIVAGTRHSLQKAARKLERSKSVPLHICVNFSPKGENGIVTTESIVLTMDLLRTSIWRWKSFRLTVPNRPQAHAALTRCKEAAPLLEVLSIHIIHSMQEDHHSHPPLPLFEGRTPRLRSCSFTSFNFNWDLGLVSRLRVLKLGGYWNGFSPSVDVILGILRACPQLEELALRNMSDVDPDSCAMVEADAMERDEMPERLVRVSDARMIQLPRLVKASFYYSGLLRTRMILSLLSIPALEKVELCFLDNVSPAIEHLRRQSLTSLPLRHMRIESSFFNEIKLVRLLRRLPSLSTLELVDVEDASSSLLKNLSTPPASQTWICPKLTVLNLEGCTTLDWDALRSVVESRLPAHAPAYPRQPQVTSAPSTPAIPCSSASSSASSSAQRIFVPSSTSTSSASAFAANAHILSRVPSTPALRSAAAPLRWPQRLQSIDLTRCHQISKEMVQWLRMYVAEVKSETPKGIWGEPSLA